MFRQLFRGYSNTFTRGASNAAMVGRAMGSIHTATPTATPTITIYHNPASALSSQLLDKLSRYSTLPCTNNKYHDGSSPAVAKTVSPTEIDPSKFSFTLKTNQPLTFTDYEFILNECADIHPHNTHVVRRLLNAHRHTPLSVSDYHKLSHTEFPVIIDYTHKLVANDEASFDRILQHYLSCGIQNSTSGGVRKAQSEASQKPSHLHNLQGAAVPLTASMVHPHVAEFADLF